MRALLTICLTAVLYFAGAESGRSATLADAIRQWTGVTTDVLGSGEHVHIVLPPGSVVPSLTARAQQDHRGAETGWLLSDIVLPPLHPSKGVTTTAATQRSSGWLGARTAELDAQYGGIVTNDHGNRIGLDTARMDMAATAGPVTLHVDLDGLHAADAPEGIASLLPQHFVLRGHTTRDGAASLVAMFGGQQQGPAPITIDTLSFDVGPAQFTGNGTMIVIGPNDRRGQVQIEATGFKELMQSMPDDGPLVKIYPALMVLRAMGEKRNGRLVWVAAFEGRQVLVNGIDIAPLLGL